MTTFCPLEGDPATDGCVCMVHWQDFKGKCSDDTSGTDHIDFAGSDSLLKSTEYDTYPDLQMFPTVALSTSLPLIFPESCSELEPSVHIIV